MSVLNARGNVPFAVRKSELGEQAVADIKRELTVQPLSFDRMGPPPNRFRLYQEDDDVLYIPKFYGRSKFGVASATAAAPAAHVEQPYLLDRLWFKGSLRPDQEEPTGALLEALRDPARGGGIMSLGCAGGKTCIALYCIAQLKRKTMVIVHKEFLLEQWRSRIGEFVPDARVGTLKAQTVDVRDKDIVLASLQSLSMKDYPPDVFADIDVMVVDEVHRTGTEVFSRAFMKFAPAFTIGLSATVQRKDGMSKVFMWYLGDVVFSRKRAREDVCVEMVHYAHPSPAYSEELFVGRSDKLNTSAMINRICDFEPRTRMVADRIAAAWREGRRTLVLCDRKAFLRALDVQLEERGVDSGFYFGGLPQATLDASAQKPVVLCTFAFASEGLDIPSLNCLFLCSPKTDIEQSVGRILRTEKHKRTQVPLIVDIVDCFSLFPAQATKRKRFYKRYHYDVQETYAGVQQPPRRRQPTAPQSSSTLEADFSRCLIID